MNVAAAVGETLVRCGIGAVFGVVGSGNFEVTNAMIAAGARYVAARHECGAATMADAYARMTGGAAGLSVHQGCGLTNAMTGITEAAKSRTPLVVVAAEATRPSSNFHVDQPALATAVGAVSMRVTSADEAVEQAAAAVATAVGERRVVLLNLPLDVQTQEAGRVPQPQPPTGPSAVPLDQAQLERLAEALRTAERPVFVAGRGARGPGCRQALERVADASGALLATSAVA